MYNNSHSECANVMDLAQKTVLVTLLLLAGDAFAQTNTQRKVSCEPDSAITTYSTLDQLIEKFGRANVRKQEVEIGEGETREGIVIFPGVSDKEIEIIPRTTNMSFCVASDHNGGPPVELHSDLN